MSTRAFSVPEAVLTSPCARCHHGAEAKCMNCAPLDPWDPRHLASFDPPIKHLSFHCHLRKLTSGVDRGKFLNLEDLSCKIRSGCLDHPPWPAGICTKCQPSAVTLSRQVSAAGTALCLMQ